MGTVESSGERARETNDASSKISPPQVITTVRTPLTTPFLTTKKTIIRKENTGISSTDKITDTQTDNSLSDYPQHDYQDSVYHTSDYYESDYPSHDYPSSDYPGSDYSDYPGYPSSPDSDHSMC